MKDIDEEIAEALNEVNWSSVSELEASSLGVSIGMYHDSTNENEQSRRLSKQAISLALIVTILCIIGLVTTVSVVAVCSSVLAAMWINVLVSKLHLFAASSLNSSQKESLINEIKSLAMKRPKNIEIDVNLDGLLDD